MLSIQDMVFYPKTGNLPNFVKVKKLFFIGPRYETLKKLEDKIEAKKIAKNAGIPTLPASDKPIKNKKTLIKWIKKNPTSIYS